MLIIGPTPFFSQSSPDHSPQPRIDFSYYEISGPDICSLICGQVYSKTGTITFIGNASDAWFTWGTRVNHLDDLIVGLFERFMVKFVPQNVVVKVNCYPKIAICIRLSGSKEETAMVNFLLYGNYFSDEEKKKREFRKPIELKVSMTSILIFDAQCCTFYHAFL